ncbi:hypothetical protein ACSSVW_001722 [Pseudoalteromonas sp. MBR-15]|jgi:hypothetical protein|uniref:DUF3019 domain-containing protein n=1 Tax=Pseudoalteromonas lipolytica TaxID=570156 RepID=UPI003BA19E82
MKYFVLSMCVFVAVIWGFPSHAQATHLAISPKVCVVLQQHDFCDLQLKISWQVAQPEDVCLYQNNQQIQCWKNTRKAQLHHKARVQVETIYSLINPHTGSKIATAKVEVQSTEAKTTRRRLRSPWSLF